MGTAVGGVSFKLDTTGIDIDKVVGDLLGTDFIRSEKEANSYKSDEFLVVRCQDVLTIYNSDFTEKFFERQDTQGVQRFVDYFKKYEFIFAHELYDSGGTFSYAFIYNGVLKRQFRSSPDYGDINFGELEDLEKGWWQKLEKRVDPSDGSSYTVHTHIETGEECYDIDMPLYMLRELLYKKLGFDDWYEDREKILEEVSYVRRQAIGAFPIVTDALPTASKPIADAGSKKGRVWWKFW